ncbi:hypothetical protein TNCV_94711 [Trichonephila clavipes]|nr:hypothetical protein TNCV_94711 [Trichonephila clavipes]
MLSFKLSAGDDVIRPIVIGCKRDIPNDSNKKVVMPLPVSNKKFTTLPSVTKFLRIQTMLKSMLFVREEATQAFFSTDSLSTPVLGWVQFLFDISNSIRSFRPAGLEFNRWVSLGQARRTTRPSWHLFSKLPHHEKRRDFDPRRI